MKRISRIILPIIMVLGISLISCDDGSSNSNSSLTEKERDALSYINEARTDPQGFATRYLKDAHDNGTDNGAYDDLMSRTPVGALEIHPDLQASAAAHSADMEANCGMQHDSCDGTSWSDRIYSYYSGNAIAENIAWGYMDAKSVVIAWIIDSGIASLGHRINMLNGSYTQTGLSELNSYWTNDFGSGGK